MREGTTVTVDIELCVNCFEESFERSDVLDNFRNISAQDEVFPCVQQFVVPFLNEGNRFKSRFAYKKIKIL